MSFQVRFTQEALDDLLRLFDFHAERNIDLARRSNAAIRQAISVLQEFPFSGRKIDPERPFLREFLVPFGGSGYVALFEIEEEHVTILAVRHQRESDYF